MADAKVDGFVVFDGCLTTTTLAVTNFTSSPFPQVKVTQSSGSTKPGASRRLVATKDFNLGDEIFSVEGILLVSHDGWGCVACNCRRCMGWCDPFRFYFQDIRQALQEAPKIATETDTPQTLIRLVLKYIALKKTSSPKLKEVLDSVLQLTNLRDETQKKIDENLADKILASLPTPAAKATLKKSELVNLIGILRTHTLPVSHLRGIGLFPIATMVDHSCRENATFEVIGNKIVVTALAIIPNGQPITFNFTKPFQPRGERLQYLKTEYHLECKCERCSPDAKDELRAFICQKCKSSTKDEDWGLVSPKGDGSKVSMWSCSKCQEAPTDTVFDKMLTAEATIAAQDTATVKVNELLLEKLFHPYHYAICRCLDVRVNLLLRIRPQACDKFLNVLLAATATYQPLHHPDRAQYYDTQGQVKKLLGDTKGCRDAFMEATVIREKTSCKTSPILLLAKQKSANPDKVEITLWHHTVSP